MSTEQVANALARAGIPPFGGRMGRAEGRRMWRRGGESGDVAKAYIVSVKSGSEGIGMRRDDLKPAVTIRGPILPEPVQVIVTVPLGAGSRSSGWSTIM